jgi:hypothetical protein
MNRIMSIDLKRSKRKIAPHGCLLLTYERIPGLELDQAADYELLQLYRLTP